MRKPCRPDLTGCSSYEWPRPGQSGRSDGPGSGVGGVGAMVSPDKLSRDSAIADRMFGWGRAMQDMGQFPVLAIGLNPDDRELGVHVDRNMDPRIVEEILAKVLELVQSGNVARKEVQP
jgi:hypothetical protein